MLVLDADQIGRLLAAANPEWRTFFLAAATTGDEDVARAAEGAA